MHLGLILNICLLRNAISDKIFLTESCLGKKPSRFNFGWHFFINPASTVMLKKKTKYKFPLDAAVAYLRNKTFILLETGLTTRENYTSYIFTAPIRTIVCFHPKDIKSVFKQIAAALKRGFYLSGFLSYEAGYAFEKKLYTKFNSKFPLIWMGVFKKPIVYNHHQNKFSNAQPLLVNNAICKENNYTLSQQRLSVSKDEYVNNIKKIKQFIETGDTYQVNYTLKYKFNFYGSAFAFYKTLRDNQVVSYAAFINTPNFQILSFSPELFFRKQKNEMTVRPMKGTAPRGKTDNLDKHIKNQLQQDKKNRAENVMIVDLLRNDLGKISKTGSVKTTSLFSVEKFKTLWQMTSTIKSKLQDNTDFLKLFCSLFPSGSVTGAPKIRTMQIIKKLEKEPRKIYTGAIGLISPKQNAVFNVAIRTVLLTGHRGEMGIGSGVTYISHAESEYAECILKARFLNYPRFELIETMRWSKHDGFWFLKLHFKRLEKSAKFFGFIFDKTKILNCLYKKIRLLKEDIPYKIRLLLKANGVIRIRSMPLPSRQSTGKLKIVLSKKKTDSKDIFLYHKTTNRTLYDTEYQKYSRLGYYDVIFQNENNQITEGAISNIFIRQGQCFYTPPVSCGLLPGVFREDFMRKNKVEEKIIRKADLYKVKDIFLVNSVRGIRKVYFD